MEWRLQGVKQGFLLQGVSYTYGTCTCGAGKVWPYFGTGPTPALLGETALDLAC